MLFLSQQIVYFWANIDVSYIIVNFVPLFEIFSINYTLNIYVNLMNI